MVGEIRDPETAQIAIQSALTGHLVFTTVHANNVFDVLGRFLNMGVEAYQFISALNCVMAQRLVRRICEACKQPMVVTREQLIESAMEPSLEQTHIFYEGAGCMECSGTGFKGRMAICELLDLTDHIREMILEKRPISEVKRGARDQGMRFLRESAVERVLHGTDDAARDQQGDLRRMSLGALFQSAPPDVAIDIGVARVSVARLSWRGAQAVVVGHASEPLAPGAVVPALAAPNLPDVSVVGRAVTAALGRLGGRPRRAALVIPDSAAKVSLLRFEKVPNRAADLMELVRWQMRKSAPFPMEQAVVSYSAGTAVTEGGQEFVVSAARRDIIEEYESACAQAGVHRRARGHRDVRDHQRRPCQPDAADG